VSCTLGAACTEPRPYRGPVTRRGADEPVIHRITAAPRPHAEDLDRRINRYLVSMAVRTACVVGVFVVPGPTRWVFAVGAVALPYVAVLFANAGDRRRATAPPRVDHRALGAGGSSVDAPRADTQASVTVTDPQIVGGSSAVTETPTPQPGDAPSSGPVQPCTCRSTCRGCRARSRFGS
jgi:hypothetical protein